MPAESIVPMIEMVPTSDFQSVEPCHEMYSKSWSPRLPIARRRTPMDKDLPSSILMASSQEHALTLPANVRQHAPARTQLVL